MKCTTPKIWPQYLLTFLCNVGTLTFGLHSGWLAPLHLRLTSEDTPLGKDARPLTTEEISWIGSIPAISFILGTTFFGYLLQRVGRRVSILLAVVPNVPCFLLLISSHNVYMIYAARFIAGLTAAGAVLVTPVYVNESTSKEVRGFLCGLSAVFVNVGVMISTAAGGYLPYWLFNTVCMGFSLVFLFFYPWLPETPVFLLTKQRGKEAREVLLKLRMNADQLQSRGAQSPGSLRKLVSDGTFARGLLLSAGVMTVHQLCGCSSILAYSTMVFHESGSSLPPVTASTVSSFMLLTGSVLGAFLMDKAGRKRLLLTSLTVMAVALSVLVAFIRLRHSLDGFDWVPAATLFAYMLTFASGIGSVSFVLVTELFLPEVRGISGAVSGTWASVIGFLTIKFFPILVESVSLTSVLVAYTVFCLTGAAFVCFYVFETKGKSTDEIMAALKGKMGGVAESNVEMQTA